MKTSHLILSLVLGGGVLAGAVTAFVRTVADDDRSPEAAPPPAAEQPEIELVSARRFALDTPYTHWWRAEQPRFDGGWLVVLRVDHELVRPRQTAEPVLVVGDETAERLNVGLGSGRVVALVPGDVDLAASPIFFAPPALPEELTEADVRARRDEAVAGGVDPIGAEAVAAALGEPLRFPSEDELRVHAADVIERHAPDEVDLVRGLRVPRIR
ncbi:MAG: hypothetical protein ACF8XB_19785 [Planctomycetota bacterium JB042]